MGPHDPVTHGQPQARPLAHILRREKGVEDAGEMFGFDPCSRVRDLHRRLPSRLGQLDFKLPALGHSVQGVEDDVDINLLEPFPLGM